MADPTAVDFKAAIALLGKLEAERSVLVNAGQVLKTLANAGPSYQEFLARIDAAKGSLASINAEIEKGNRTRTEIAALARDERGRYVAEKAKVDQKLDGDRKAAADQIEALRKEIVALKNEKSEVLNALNAEIATAQEAKNRISAEIDRIRNIAG